MIIPDPKKQQWSGIFPGKFLGNIWDCFNIDLERSEGEVVQSERTAVVSSSESFSFVPKHFLKTDADTHARWWALTTGGYLFKGNIAGSIDSFANDTSGPLSPLDMVVHETNNGNQRLLTSVAADLAILNSVGSNNIWDLTYWTVTLGQTALNSSVPHPIENYDRVAIIADGNMVHTLDQNNVPVYARLLFDPKYVIVSIYISIDYVWFGLKNIFNGRHAVGQWDSGSLVANQIYSNLDGIPFSGFVYDNIPYFILDNGRIVKFTGAGFTSIAVFPIFEEKLRFNITTVFYRNTALDGSMIHINLTMPITSRRMRSGVWTLDLGSKPFNLYHHWSPSLFPVGGSTAQEYDYGQAYTGYAGGVVVTQDTEINGRIIFGAEVYQDYGAPTMVDAIFRVYTNQYYTRSRFSSAYFLGKVSNIETYFENLWLRFRNFFTSRCLIVTKYRVSEGLMDVAGLPLYATMNQFHASLSSISGVVPVGVNVGNEIEILAGYNAGFTAHIKTLSAIPDGSSSITVGLDEAVPYDSGGTNGILVRFEDWIKIPPNPSTTSTITNPNNPIVPTTLVQPFRSAYQPLGSPGINGPSGPYLQVKVEMRGSLMGVSYLNVDPEDQTESNV